jgi:hypothetical protein
MSIVIMQSAWAGLTPHDLDSNIDSSNYPCSDPPCSFESVNEQRRVPARGDQVWSPRSTALGRRPQHSRTGQPCHFHLLGALAPVQLSLNTVNLTIARFALRLCTLGKHA